MNKNLLSITDTANILKVSDKTLRRWEAKGLLIPKRSKGGHRRYLKSQVFEFLKSKKENKKVKILSAQIVKAPSSFTQVSLTNEFSNLHSDPRIGGEESFIKKILLYAQNHKRIPFVDKKAIITVFLSIIALAIGNASLLYGKDLTNYLGKFGIGKSILDSQEQAAIVNQKAFNRSVLGDATAKKNYIFTVNVPSSFKQSADFLSDVTVKGTLTAPNILNGVKAGTGISVGSGQIPLITNTDLGSAQNIFKNIKVGSNTISAGSNSDTFTLAGSGAVSLSTDTSNKIITISSSAPDLSAAGGWTDDGTIVRLTTSTDSVGIGTANPGYTLDVQGGKINSSVGFCIAGDCKSAWSQVGGVSSVSNSDGTLTISPTTGAIVASLNLANANIWTGTQTLNSPIIQGTVGAGTGLTLPAFTASGNITGSGSPTISGFGTINGVTISSTALTFASTVPTISVSTAATNIILDAGTTGKVQIANGSSGDVDIGGGSSLTGCTITNSNGNFSCSGSLNGLTVSSGTISSGTWNGTVIGTLYGGLGADVSAATGGELLYSTSTSAYGHLVKGTSTQVLTSGGVGAPVWVDQSGLTGVVPSFNNITSGTNTQAAMVVSTGASLTYLGGTATSGVINANQLLAGTWAVPGTIGSTTANTGAFTTLSATPGSNSTALTLTGTNLSSANLAYFNAKNTSGTIFNIAYGASATLAGDLVGQAIDLNNGMITDSSHSITGFYTKLPTITADNATGTVYLKGLAVEFGTGSGINQTGAGALTYTGTDILIPAITQTAGTVTANGLLVTTPSSITTGGTAYGINISPTGVGAGTLSGINIGTINSAGAGAETAIAVGTGWDNVLKVGSTAVINGSGVVQVAGGGTGISSYTAGDLIYASGTTTLSQLAGGSANNGKVLVVSSGLPTWGTMSGSSCTDCLVNDPTATQTLAPTGANVSGLSIRQTSTALGGNTPDIFNVTSSNGSTKYFSVDYQGNVSTGSISNTTLTLTPTTDTTALTLVGTNVSTAKLAYINSKNLQGTIFDISYGAAATLNNNQTVTGQNIDLSTNVTANSSSTNTISLSGQAITLPGVTNTNTSGTNNLKGIVISVGSGLNQNGVGGTTIFSGADITIPALTQTAGTLTGNGVLITTPTSITTGGTANGVNISASGIGVGTLNGLNISGITAGSGTETAVNIGNNWDTGLSIGSISSSASGTGISIGNISSTGLTNYGVNVGNISGATTTNYGFNIGTLTGGTGSSVYGINTGTLTSVASGTNFQANFGAVVGATGATFGSIQTGAISGGTGVASYGLNLGANSSSATTKYGVNIGAISGGQTTNYGINVGAISDANSNYAINTGTLTSTLPGTNFQANFGAVSGADIGDTYGSIQTGAISGTSGIVTYGINLGANSAQATTNYGVKIGAVSGSSGPTTNYGLYIGAVTGATTNYGLYVAGGQSYFAHNGGASDPAIALAGTWYSGGTATTTKPQLLIEPSGTSSTAWSTSGTGLGVNAASGFAGNLLDLQVAGTSKLKIDASGNITDSGYVSAANTSSVLYTSSTGLVARSETPLTSGQCFQTSNATGGLTWSTCGAAAIFQEVSGLISPISSYTTDDFIIGATATTSAAFALKNVGAGGDVTLAIRGKSGTNNFLNLSVDSSDNGNISMTNAGTINIGAGGGHLYVNTDILNDTTSNLGAVLVSDQFTVSVGLATASAIFNNSSTGDILTASTSGTTKFVISNAGNVGIGTTTPAGKLSIAGAVSASAWGTAGIAFQEVAATYTDSSSSGTVANAVANSLGIPTFAASSSTTFTAASTLYIAGPPTAGTNVTITNPASFIVATGNVGIGTTAPGHILAVSGSNSAGNVASFVNLDASDNTTRSTLRLSSGRQCSSGGQTNKIRILQVYGNATTDADGTAMGNIGESATTTCSLALVSGSADYAEYFPVINPDEKPISGELVSYDVGQNKAVKKTNQKEDKLLAGVVSTEPIVVGNGPSCLASNQEACEAEYERTHVRVALIGQVPTRVSSENGQINVGDPLTSSSISGVAMKATKAGVIIGKALENYSNSDSNAVGTIIAFISPSWYDPSVYFAKDGSLENGQNQPSGNSVTNSAFQDLSNKVEDLSAKYAKLQDMVTFLSTQSANTNFDPMASGSGILSNLDVKDATISATLSVLGRTTLSDVGITGDVSIGLLTIKGLTSEINSLSGPLKLQSSALDGIEMVAGKVIVDKDGNIKTEGAISAKSIETTEYKVLGDKTIGSGIIPAGQLSVDIQASVATDSSKIFLTPTTLTDKQLVVTNKKIGKFTVGISSSSLTPITFDWWVVGN